MEVKELKNKVSAGLCLIDEEFSANSNEDRHLCLQAGREGMAVGILAGNKFIALETYTFQGVYGDEALKECIENVFAKSKILQSGNFKKVSFACIDNKSALVPAALYDDSQKQTYFKFNHELLQGEEVCVDTIKNIDAKNVYVVPNLIRQFLLKKFGHVSFFHFSTPLIDSLITVYKNQAARKVLVHVQLSHFEVIVLEGKNLVFYNTFNYTTAEDCMYYLLFVFEQLKLNPETQDVVVIGEIERNSTIYGLLLKYIRSVKFGDRPENFSYSYKLNELPKHFYYNLFTLPLCV